MVEIENKFGIKS